MSVRVLGIHCDIDSTIIIKGKTTTEKTNTVLSNEPYLFFLGPRALSAAASWWGTCCLLRRGDTAMGVR